MNESTDFNLAQLIKQISKYFIQDTQNNGENSNANS